jgi:hypothetical protein
VVGSFFTIQEMGGFSLSLFAVEEDDLPWWDAPARGPYFCWPRESASAVWKQRKAKGSFPTSLRGSSPVKAGW